MTRPKAPALTVLACLAGAALWSPVSEAASSGGAGMPPSGGSGSSSAGHAQPGNLTASATTNGVTIAARESALLHMGLQVSGSLPSADSGRIVQVQLRGAQTGWRWAWVAQTRARGDGSFSATWKPNHSGQFAVRAVVGAASARDASGGPTITVTVYRPSVATLYGPGFYGRHTACGTVLRRATLGVANRTLPCGTLVSLYYGGKIIVVPVIDRGPYTRGVGWDLTMATGKALGMYTTARIGAVSVPHAR